METEYRNERSVHLMAEVSATPKNARNFRKITAVRVAWLESQTDEIGVKIELPQDFIVPGDTQSGAYLAFARTVIRRAERQVARLLHHQEIENMELAPLLESAFLALLCPRDPGKSSRGQWQIHPGKRWLSLT